MRLLMLVLVASLLPACSLVPLQGTPGQQQALATVRKAGGQVDLEKAADGTLAVHVALGGCEVPEPVLASLAHVGPVRTLDL